jgi:hypothetical protein
MNSLRSKLGLFLFWLMTLTAWANAPQDSPRFRFGLFEGWMHGSHPPYGGGAYIGGHDVFDYRLQFDIGGYVEFDLLRRLAVQAEAMYQTGAFREVFSYGNLIHYVSNGQFGVFSLTLGAVYTEPIVKWLSYFLKAGGGLSWGDWYNFGGTYFNFNFGVGLKYYPRKPPSRLALVFFIALQDLLKPYEYYTCEASALRFSFGIEF